MAVEPSELRQVEFLAPLKDRALRRLAEAMTERAVPAGQDIVAQGDTGVAFFVILSGDATVIVDGEERRRLGPGDHFGEIALVVPDVQRSRTATVRATSDVRVAAMAEWNFKGFVSDNPEVTWPLLVTLARQLVG